MSDQLPLHIGLQEPCSFENFVAGANTEALTYCRGLAEGSHNGVAYLWGATGTGKSHLLQAACHQVSDRDGRPAYLPMLDLMSMDQSVIADLETLDLICIDDVHAIAGIVSWELSLFHLYNRIKSEGGRLIVTGRHNIPALGVELQDLASRLAWGVVFHLSELDDNEKLEALSRYAAGRGLSLPAEVAHYLLHHVKRDMHALFKIVKQLDVASLSTHRKLTIPFVKGQLGL